MVGGGSTGVEVAAELHDLFHTAAKTFTADPPLEPRVVLVHGGPYLLNSFGESLGKYTTRRLAKTGVELVLNRRLASVEADRVVLDDGTDIATETVVSTVGNAPHPVVTALGGSHDERGWILPDATLPRARPRPRLGARRLRLDHRPEERPADARHGPARRPRGTARGAQHPRRRSTASP